MRRRVSLWTWLTVLSSFVLIIYFLFFYCVDVEGIKISGLLRARSFKDTYKYCALLRRSLNGDKNSLKDFSTLDIYDAASYDHGSILVKVICRIGPANYLEAIEGVSDDDRNAIEVFLRVGIEYGAFEDSLCVDSVIQEVLQELNKEN